MEPLPSLIPPAVIEPAIDAWLGTPFMARCAVRQGGCDCVRFAYAVYQDMGLIPAIDWPEYALRPINVAPYWKLREALEGIAGVKLVWQSAVQPPDEACTPLTKVPSLYPGDALVFSTGRSFHHVGLVRDHLRFAHCLPEQGVVLHSLMDFMFMRRLRAVYRLTEISNFKSQISN